MHIPTSSSRVSRWLRRALAPVIVVLCAGQSLGAAEIRVFAMPGIKSVLDEIGPEFERSSGHKLFITYIPNIPMLRRIDEGDEFDFIVTNAEDIPKLVERRKVAPDTGTPLGRTGIGVWIRPGAQKPDISSVDRFKQLLLNAESISYTIETGTGQYMAQLIKQLGIADAVAPKTKLMHGGGENPRAAAAGDVQYGISIVSDGIGLPGVELLGLLPEEIQNWVTSVGAPAFASHDRGASKEFQKFLTSKDNAAAFRSKGWMENQ